MLSLICTLLVAASHPGLLFSQSDVGPLREAASSTHQSIASHITTILDAHLNDAMPTTTTYDDPRFYGDAVAAWAFGYQITGKTAYADKARNLLFTYLGWSDWGFGEIASMGTPDLNIGHFLTGVSLAYDWLYPYLSAADRSSIATRLGTEADRMASNLPNAWYVDEYVQNHNWINTAGLGLAALVLSGEDARAAGWLTLAQGNLAKLALSELLIPDGTHHEGMGYEMYGLSMSLPFWTALARTGADYTDNPLLRGVGKYWLYAQIPDNAAQQITPFGDYSGWPNQQTLEVLRYTAGRFNDGLAERAAQRFLGARARGTFLPELFYDVFEFLYYDPTVPATDPATLPLEQGFSDMGIGILHSQWGAGDLVAAIKAGPFTGHTNFERVKAGGAPGGWLAIGHDHTDDMGFWLYGKGTFLAPEAVGYNGAAIASAYHNVLLVDGNGELGDSRPSDSNWNNTWFFQRNATTLIDPVGTADYAISGGQGASLFAASAGVSRWDRMLVLARGRYALVRDDVQAAASHNYDWLCHFPDGVSVDTASGWVQGTGKNGQSLGVRVVSPAAWTATTGSQTASLMNLFDSDGSTSYVKVRPASAAANVQFLTALMPIATASWASRATINALDANDTGAGAVIAPGSPLEERWIFNRVGSDGHAAGDLALTGSLAGVVGRDATGAHRRAALFGAGKLMSGSTELLSSLSARAIEADLQGTALIVTGNGIADFHAWAPAATSLVLNGQAVAASFENGMVVYPALAAGGASADAGSGGTGGSTDAGTGGGSGGSGGNGPGADGGTSSSSSPDGVSVAATSVAPTKAGCSTGGIASLWPALGLAALAFRRRRA